MTDRDSGIVPDHPVPHLATSGTIVTVEGVGNIRLMAERGRIGWQRATGYGRRNHAETTMGRYKHLIGPKLRARTLPGQRGEVAIAVNVLNGMIRTGKPVTVRAR